MRIFFITILSLLALRYLVLGPRRNTVFQMEAVNPVGFPVLDSYEVKVVLVTIGTKSSLGAPFPRTVVDTQGFIPGLMRVRTIPDTATREFKTALCAAGCEEGADMLSFFMWN